MNVFYKIFIVGNVLINVFSSNVVLAKLSPQRFEQNFQADFGNSEPQTVKHICVLKKSGFKGADFQDIIVNYADLLYLT